MKHFLMVFMAIFITIAASAQNGASCCPLKNSPLCPMKAMATASVDHANIADCPLKGTPECPMVAKAATAATENNLADCPLRGTPQCPLRAAMTDAEKRNDLASASAAVPACCAKKH